jgi:hypothetical protein
MTPSRIISMNRGNRFSPCEATPSRLASANSRAHSAARSAVNPCAARIPASVVLSSSKATRL